MIPFLKNVMTERSVTKRKKNQRKKKLLLVEQKERDGALATLMA